MSIPHPYHFWKALRAARCECLEVTGCFLSLQKVFSGELPFGRKREEARRGAVEGELRQVEGKRSISSVPPLAVGLHATWLCVPAPVLWCVSSAFYLAEANHPEISHTEILQE